MSVSDPWSLASPGSQAVPWFQSWRSNLACVVAPMSVNDGRRGFDSRERRDLEHRPTAQTRTEFITSRMAAKLLARKRYGRRLHHYRIDHDESGAPHLLTMGKRSHGNVSLAHANGWGGAMLGPLPVGFDLEFCDPANRDIGRYLGDESEWNRLREIIPGSDEKTGRMATAMLSIKESVLKAMRRPITIPREQVTLGAIRPSGDIAHAFDFSAASCCRRHSFDGRLFCFARLMISLCEVKNRATNQPS